MPVSFQAELGTYDQPFSMSLSTLTADYMRRAVSQALLLLTDAANWQVQPDSGGEIEASVLEAGRLYSLLEFSSMAGQVAFFAGSIPDGWNELNGDTLAASDYPLLASAVPSWVSGSSINLPDYRGLFPLAASGSYSNLSTGGESTHTLTSLEMPSHSHTEVSATPTLIAIGAGVPAPSAIPGFGVTGASGTGLAHNNMPPYVALRMAVKLW